MFNFSSSPVHIKIRKKDSFSDESCSEVIGEGGEEEDLSPCRDVEQKFIFLKGEEERERLSSLLSLIQKFIHKKRGKIIIFCEQRNQGSFSSFHDFLFFCVSR